tara:strand:- start:949 stop:1251 length:303 start_codon:yes stop_codon:yes gene_type:complete
MKKMIEFTEVFSASSEYDPVAGRVKTDFGLRRIVLNREHVICFRENEDYNSRSESLVEGLSKHTSFTRLFLTRSNAGPTLVDVVGSLEQISDKLNVALEE